MHAPLPVLLGNFLVLLDGLLDSGLSRSSPWPRSGWRQALAKFRVSLFHFFAHAFALLGELFGGHELVENFADVDKADRVGLFEAAIAPRSRPPALRTAISLSPSTSFTDSAGPSESSQAAASANADRPLLDRRKPRSTRPGQPARNTRRLAQNISCTNSLKWD